MKLNFLKVAVLMLCLVVSACVSNEPKSAPPKSAKEPPPGEPNPLKPIPNRHAGKYTEGNGIKMYYEIYGEGEPLLLLHGGSASIEGWFDQIPEFSKSFR